MPRGPESRTSDLSKRTQFRITPGKSIRLTAENILLDDLGESAYYSPRRERRTVKPTDLLQGTLDMLILKAVSLGELHGYGVLLRIQQLSGKRLEILQGSL